MKKLRTCLGVLLTLAVATAAQASPETREAACEMRFTVSAEDAFENPMARWLGELGEPTGIRVDASRWDVGLRARAEISMGGKEAFYLEGIRTGGEAVFVSSAAKSPLRVSCADQRWVQPFFDMTARVFDLPEGGRLIPVSGEGFGRAADKAAVNMRAWAADTRAKLVCEDCGGCESCAECLFAEAMAAAVEALGDRFDNAACDKNVLLMDIDPVACRDFAPEQEGPDIPDAPDDFPVLLLKKGVCGVALTIAGCAETEA